MSLSQVLWEAVTSYLDHFPGVQNNGMFKEADAAYLNFCPGFQNEAYSDF
jgi:hypothetical protein